MSKQRKSRRAMLAGLGAVATGALAGRTASAQTTSTAPFTPAMHTEDGWLSAMPGKHRVVLDVTSPEGLPDVVRFVSNLYTGHKSGYGVEESDLAIVVCFRHGATAYGYADAIWSKYGKTIDAKATPPPTVNPYNSGTRLQLTDMSKRGVQFMVCGTASRGLAGRIAGQSGDTDAVMKEMAANLIPSARIVPAGVVGVSHAQERGFALIYVG
jgi:intracellular sulfur oxidation DsrE/DsrF family protein